jgi:hypothetical protein
MTTGSALRPIIEQLETLRKRLQPYVPAAALQRLPLLTESDFFDVSTLDLTDLLQAMKVPDFSSHCVPPNYLAHFRRRFKGVREIFAALDSLFEAGAAPTARKEDVFVVWWELANVPVEHFVRTEHAEDQISVVAESERTEWVRLHGERVAASMRRISSDGASQGQWRDNSVLSTLGYSVGAAGKNASVRQRALHDAVMFPLQLVPIERRGFWGVEATRARVRAIRAHIRRHRQLEEGRRDANMKLAIEHRTQDLEWLDSQYRAQ